MGIWEVASCSERNITWLLKSEKRGGATWMKKSLLQAEKSNEWENRGGAENLTTVKRSGLVAHKLNTSICLKEIKTYNKRSCKRRK